MDKALRYEEYERVLLSKGTWNNIVAGTRRTNE